MTRPTQQSIETDTTIEPAVGPPWSLDPEVRTWRADDGTEIRFQFREKGAVLQVGQYNLCIADPRSASPFEPAPPLPVGLVEAFDCSSYQPRDLSVIVNGLSPRPQHAIIRLYQALESPDQQHSIDQIQSAWSLGLTVSGYVWLYSNVDGWASANEAIDLAESVGLQLPILYLDCETYTDGSYPSIANIQRAVDACLARQVPVGIYSGEWFWRDYLGNTTQFSHLPLLHAAYGAKPDALYPVDYGGWQLPCGVQWTSDPVDRDLVDASVTV